MSVSKPCNEIHKLEHHFFITVFSVLKQIDASFKGFLEKYLNLVGNKPQNLIEFEKLGFVTKSKSAAYDDVILKISDILDSEYFDERIERVDFLYISRVQYLSDRIAEKRFTDLKQHTSSRRHECKYLIKY